MWYDSCGRGFYITICIFEIFTEQFVLGNDNNCHVGPFEGEATLWLSDTDQWISDRIFESCPKNVTQLTIQEVTHGIKRILKREAFFFETLPHLKTIKFQISNLLFEQGSKVGLGVSALRFIWLSRCGLSYIPLGAFKGLVDLQTLDLSNNHLTELPPDLFAYNPLLRAVNASHNSITFLPRLTPTPSVHDEYRVVDVSGNPIDRSCINSYLLKQLDFQGVPEYVSEIQPCEPIFSARLETSVIESKNDSSSLFILNSHSLILSCTVSATLPVSIFWISPVGVIPSPDVSQGNVTHVYSYTVQPLFAPTTLRITLRANETEPIVIGTFFIENIRGHLSGDWYCVARSPIGLSVSTHLAIHVVSSMYYSRIYYFSLCYGYGAMAVLLLVGIIGGTIRYCSETHCLRRPQPPFAYGGKTFIGVIPVPAVDEDSLDGRPVDGNTSYDIAETSVRYISAGQLCNVCQKLPTYWFCSECKAVHFVEAVRRFNQEDLPGSARDLPIGVLTLDGEIKLDTSNLSPLRSHCTKVDNLVCSDPKPTYSEAHCPLIDRRECNVQESREATFGKESNSVSQQKSFVYVRSGGCVIRIRAGLLSADEASATDDVSAIVDAICCHSKPRPNSTDVKLVVSNEKLAEEYRDALADLARAVESPDPAHFREHLEEFRSRLRRDVGHGVKVLRGEFQGLREKSAKGVASLRNQSSAAAQRMRAGFSHGVEQVKGGMRSMAELCGASGTIGQTISVISVYVDETDQTKKERLISDFTF
ncbi:hypothetical protein AHF37_11287 [Paragonimus kellicotti]|nr:hypothetical protein AHF37_11287 [Paragonimus kellicotti]